MTDVVDFVNKVAAAQSSEAKDVLHNLMSQKAFSALDDKKQDLAKNMFSNGTEPEEIEDVEVEVQDTADSPVEDPEAFEDETDMET